MRLVTKILSDNRRLFHGYRDGVCVYRQFVESVEDATDGVSLERFLSNRGRRIEELI